MIIVGLEFGAVFVERDGMAEEADRSIGGCKREGMGHQPNRANRIPAPRNTVGPSSRVTLKREHTTRQQILPRHSSRKPS